MVAPSGISWLFIQSCCDISSSRYSDKQNKKLAHYTGIFIGMFNCSVGMYVRAPDTVKYRSAGQLRVWTEEKGILHFIFMDTHVETPERCIKRDPSQCKLQNLYFNDFKLNSHSAWEWMKRVQRYENVSLK